LEFLNTTDTEVRKDGYVSEKVGSLLAKKCYHKGIEYMKANGDPNVQLVGIGCTASIKTYYQKKGSHMACISSYNGNILKKVSIVMKKNKRSRMEEDFIVCALMLKLLAEFCEVNFSIDLGLGDGDILEESREDILYGNTLLNQVTPTTGVTNLILGNKCSTCKIGLKLSSLCVGKCVNCSGNNKCRLCLKDCNTSVVADKKICSDCWRNMNCYFCKQNLNEKDRRHKTGLCNVCWDALRCNSCKKKLKTKEKNYENGLCNTCFDKESSKGTTFE
jgi:hypothetical protein